MRRGWFGLIGLLFLLVGCTTPTTPSTNSSISGTVSAPGGGDVNGTVVGACPVSGGGFSCTNAVRVTVTQSGSSASYSINVPAGSYVIVAIKDINSNSQPDTGDFYGCSGQQGSFPNDTCTARTAPASGVAVTMQVISGGAAGEPYNITIRYNGTFSTAQRTAFENSAARWGQVITQGFADLTNASVPANACGSGASAFSGTIDDVLIDARVTAIDGPGGVLAQAGPCLRRGSNNLTFYGVMEFDSADVGTSFESTVLHEMGHVLGIGTLWNVGGRNLLVGGGDNTTCGTNPTFVGVNAVREWRTLGGTGNIPVENSGGTGTCDGHWRESVFGPELMTGFDNPGVPNPLSRMTIGSLQDLGYTVDYSKADAFALPAPRALALANPTPRGIVVFDPSQMGVMDDTPKGLRGQRVDLLKTDNR